MGKKAIMDLTDKRRKKLVEYTRTPSYSYKKQIRKYELEIIETKIAIERLRMKFEG